MFSNAGSRVGRGALNYDRPLRTKLQLAANQNLNHDVWTTVVWDTVVVDEINAYRKAANAKIVTVPQGINYVKVAIQFVFQNNLTTAAFVALCKNGTDSISNAIRFSITPSGFQMPIALRTDHIPVVPGDTLYVMGLFATTLGANGGFSGTDAWPSRVEYRWFPQ